jgi:(R)-2-hydroxyacyl-CoA dehydratese activating ATPase
MITAGLDIGSRTIALVEWDGTNIIRQDVVFTGQDPLENSRRLINGRKIDRLVSTGYGRHLAAERNLSEEVITEIRAYAIGSHHLYPDVRTILDIGGQDSKVISVNADGNVVKFEMNDRCAAGTGRFLENMATALDLKVEAIGPHAIAAEGKAIQISSMCTVFAESETVSLLGKGEKSQHIALGIHLAIVKRVAAMVRRVGLKQRLIFAGGVAQNPCMQILLAEELGVPVTVPDNPQIVGALGAAIYAARNGIN